MATKPEVRPELPALLATVEGEVGSSGGEAAMKAAGEEEAARAAEREARRETGFVGTVVAMVGRGWKAATEVAGKALREVPAEAKVTRHAAAEAEASPWAAAEAEAMIKAAAEAEAEVVAAAAAMVEVVKKTAEAARNARREVSAEAEVARKAAAEAELGTLTRRAEDPAAKVDALQMEAHEADKKRWSASALVQAAKAAAEVGVGSSRMW